MDSKTLFRVLVCTQLAVALAGTFLSFSVEGMPPALADYMATPPDVSDFYLAVGGFQIILMAVVFFGLLFFWRPSRWLYVGERILLLVAASFGPPGAHTGLSWSVYSASLFLSGVMVAAMFLPPINSHFEKQPERPSSAAF